MPTTVLVTRPQPAADELAGILRDRFGDRVRVVVSPAMEIERGASPRIEEGEVLLVTSANALWAAEGLPNRVVCVGEATTRRAVHAGLKAECIGETAQDLAETLQQGTIKGRLHYLRGQQIARDLRHAAQAGGGSLRESVVYRQRPIPPNAQALAAIDVDVRIIALLMSPASARNFANGLSDGQRRKCRVLAMSSNIAQQIESKAFCSIDCAPVPTLESLLETLSERL